VKLKTDVDGILFSNCDFKKYDLPSGDWTGLLMLGLQL
jgi:hypothetical protein